MVVIAGHKAVEIADAAVSERVQVLHHEAHVGGFVAHDRAAGFAADAVDHDIRDSGLFDIPELARVDHVGHDQPRDFPLRHRVVEVPDRLAGNEVEGVVQLRQFARNHIDRVGDRVGLPQQVAVVEQKRNLAVLLVPQRTENAVRPVAAGFDLLENAFPQLRLHGEVLAAAVQHPAHGGGRNLQLLGDFLQCHKRPLRLFISSKQFSRLIMTYRKRNVNSENRN